LKSPDEATTRSTLDATHNFTCIPAARNRSPRALSAVMMQAMKGFGTQPSHTFIEGAHLFSRTRARTLGDEALSALERWAPDASSLADAIGLPRNACEP
jgi:hypothetical protein